MAESFREHSCPNCGAPLGIPEKHARFFKCQFCGTILEDQASEEEQTTGIFKIKISEEDISSARVARAPVYTAPPSQTPRGSNRLGCIIGAAIFLLVGGILSVSLVPALIASGTISEFIDGADIVESVGLQKKRFIGYGPTALLSSDNDTSKDFIGVARGADSKTYLTYIDFENEPVLRWINEISGDQPEYVFNQFLADDVRVYFSSDTKITAFNREIGTLLWELALTDKIQHYNCEGCFQIIGNKIAALSTDGVLSTWETETGALNWQVALNATPRQVVNFGGNPAVLDDIEGSVGFTVFNLSDGAIQQQIFPTCPSTPFPDQPQELSTSNYIQPLSDNTGVVFFGGFFEPGCALHWLPGEDAPTWMAEFDSKIVLNLNRENVLQTKETIFIAHNTQVHALDLATGTFTTLYEEEGFNLFPLDAREGVLVLGAERTRGTRLWEIWGLDTQLGNVKWTYEPDAEDFSGDRSNSTTVFDGGLWEAGLTSDGLTIAQAFTESPRIFVQTISLQSGTATSPTTVNLSGASSVFQFKVLGWQTNGLWLYTDAQQPSIRLLDVTNGENTYIWP